MATIPQQLSPLLLLVLAACATPAGQELASTVATPRRAVTGMIEPASGRLMPRFADVSVSLAALIERAHGQRLDGNDRRFIDAAYDAALVDAPAAPARRWRNPANGHAGEVDLLAWQPDLRKGELCGIFRHASKLGERQLAGSLTVCRGEHATAWRVDQLALDRPVAAPQPDRRELAPTSRTSQTAAGPRTAPAAKPATRPAAAEPPAAREETDRSGAGSGPEATGPAQVLVPRPTGLAPGTGDRNIGDLLQDQSSP